MPGPLAGIIARIGAGLFGQAAAQQAGTKAAAGVAGVGANLSERATVLRKAGRLLSKAEVSNYTGKKAMRIGLEERIGVSEKVAAEDEKAATKVDKFVSALGTLSPIVVSLAGAALGIAKLGDAVDGITTLILERQRELAPLSGQIATAFAKLELRTRVIQVERAGAVGGSTAVLADAIGDLRETLEPLRQTFTTGVNVMVTVLAKVAEGVAILVQLQPTIQLIAKVAGLYENFAGKDEGMPFKENLGAMLRGDRGPGAGKLPLGRDQGVSGEERRDAEERAGLGRRGQEKDQDEQQGQAAENKRRLREIAGTA